EAGLRRASPVLCALGRLLTRILFSQCMTAARGPEPWMPHEAARGRARSRSPFAAVLAARCRICDGDLHIAEALTTLSETSHHSQFPASRCRSRLIDVFPTS